MNILIVSGGQVDDDQLKQYINEDYYIIGVDKGLDSIARVGGRANLAIGDFDSANADTKELYEHMRGTIILKPEKDVTDTHEAVVRALSLEPESIVILGATGSRVDHMLGNIGLLMLCHKQNVEAYIVDTHNKIRIISNTFTIKKANQFGDFISFIPYDTVVYGVTLNGFKYDVECVDFKKHDTLGISNEIREEEGSVSIKEGYLIVIESRD